MLEVEKSILTWSYKKHRHDRIALVRRRGQVQERLLVEVQGRGEVRRVVLLTTDLRAAVAVGPGLKLGVRQTLQGSFSAVSKRNFASKYAFESSRRDLHNALLCTAPKSHVFFKTC